MRETDRVFFVAGSRELASNGKMEVNGYRRSGGWGYLGGGDDIRCWHLFVCSYITLLFLIACHAFRFLSAFLCFATRVF